MKYPITSMSGAVAAAVITIILGGPPAVAWPGHARPMLAGSRSTPVEETRRSRRRGPERQVESRIAQLHERLQITAAQEDKFKAMADAMTANAQSMEALLQERSQDNDTSAQASLRWYGRLADAHAEALKKFLPPFDDLYASLSDSQKRTADAMFRRFGQGPSRHRFR